MKERPILYSGSMVRARREGRKTQTRRVLKKQPVGSLGGPDFDGLWSDTKDPVVRYFGCPYGKPGDRLWVRETWGTLPAWDSVRPSALPIDLTDEVPSCQIFYEEDWSETSDLLGVKRWRPSIHMPRRASRTVLEVVSVRVERLQDISEEDAIAEGIISFPHKWNDMDYPFPDVAYKATEESAMHWTCPKRAFQDLWESINGPGSWDANPWVWVVEFRDITEAGKSAHCPLFGASEVEGGQGE